MARAGLRRGNMGQNQSTVETPTPKKQPAKTRTATPASKRPAPEGSHERPDKTRRTSQGPIPSRQEANTKKRIDTGSPALTPPTTAPARNDVIEIPSDSDDDVPLLQPRRSSSRLRARAQSTASAIIDPQPESDTSSWRPSPSSSDAKAHELDVQRQLDGYKSQNEDLMRELERVKGASDRQNARSQARIKQLETDLQKARAATHEEVNKNRNLQRQLDKKEAEASASRNLQDEMKKAFERASQSELERQAQRFTEKERRLVAEKEDLQNRLANVTKGYDGLQNDLSQYRSELQAEKTRTADLVTQLDTATQQTLTVTRQLVTANSEIEKLKAANELLKEQRIRTPTPSISLPSSLSSSSPDDSSDMQIKLKNVSKTYMNVKRRHDTILAAAKNFAATARGMRLDEMGNFGRYLGQLVRAVDDD